MNRVHDQAAKLLLQNLELLLRVLRRLNELFDDTPDERFLEEFLPQIDGLFPNESLQLVLLGCIQTRHFFDLTSQSLCDNLRAETNADQLDVLMVLVDVLYQASDDWQPRCPLDIIDGSGGPRNNYSLHLGQLGFRGQVEVEYVVDAPLFDIRTAHTTHKLAHDHALVDSLEEGTPVDIHHRDLRVERHGEHSFLRDEHARDETLSHVHDQLQIEPGYVCADEILVQNLTQGDPVQTQILVLRTLKVLHECHVDRFNSEEGQRVEDCQVILSDDFHVRCILRIPENLQDLLDLLVRENVELIILHKLIVHDPLNLSRQGQAGQFRGQTQASALANERSSCRK